MKTGMLITVGALVMSTITPFAAGSLGASSVASATESAEQEIREFLTENNVPAEQQTQLVEKLANGEKWDSLGGVRPASTTTTEEDGQLIILERYPDGSVVRSTIDDPQQHASRSVTSCNLTSSSSFHNTYTNCYGNVEFGIVQMGFHFDRTSYKETYRGKITKYYGTQFRVVGGTMSNHKLERFSESRVRYSGTVSTSKVQFTAWMEAHVGMGNSAWTTHL